MSHVFCNEIQLQIKETIKTISAEMPSSFQCGLVSIYAMPIPNVIPISKEIISEYFHITEIKKAAILQP